MELPYLTTSRLKLRQWESSDFIPFAKLNADPVTMKYFPSTLTTEQSDALIRRFQDYIAQNHFGAWAVELRESGEFIGMTGLATPRFEAHFTPCIEIGWRFAKEYWGNGYATEAAKAAIDYGFSVLSLDEIVAFTTEEHHPSRKVMSRIGMTQDIKGSFIHPDDLLSESPHELVLYRIKKDDWLNQQKP